MHEVRLKIRHASLLLFGLFWVFDVVTPERVGDIARYSSFSYNKYLRRSVNLHFVSEGKPGVVREISCFSCNNLGFDLVHELSSVWSKLCKGM